LNAAVSGQTRSERTYHPLSDKFGIGIEAGATYTKSDFKDSQFDIISRIHFDYYFPTLNSASFGLRAFGGYGYLAGEDTIRYNLRYIENFRTEIIFIGGAFTFNYAVSDFFIPYLSIGISYLYFDPRDKDGNELPLKGLSEFSPHQVMLPGEIGFKFLVSENLSLNLNASVDYVPTDQLDGLPNSITQGTDKDVFFALMGGITYYFGGVKDTDSDGVRDRDDLCPATPPGVIVDQFGCPVDTDRDGVPDYIDECPNTPVNIPVDVNGCPVDADRDGVPDYLDLCKDTPMGVAVDIRGCPLDSDDDGVPDYKDLCPNTPVGTEVNKWGCPIEEKVYEPITKTEFVLSGGVNFESNKFDLLPAAYPELDKVLKVMRDYPDTKWKIEGHTDNTGSDKLNRELSINRAKSVYNYFVSNGISANRLSYNGYGPDYPIADNSTETGKALNRRVTIVLVGDNETQPTEVLKPVVNRNYNSAVERNVGKMIFTDGYLYTVQVSSWRSRAKAESEVKRLQDQGYNAFIIIAELPDLDGTWYRVRVGYFNTFEEASKVREKI
jgi:OOP family OmpA-OmpF porin